MPRTALPVQAATVEGGNVNPVSFTAADQANDHEFDNVSGDVLLLINCVATAAQTITIQSVADEYGRLAPTAATTIVVPTNGLIQAGPFPPSRWNQSGKVYVDLTVNTGVSFAAVRANSFRR